MCEQLTIPIKKNVPVTTQEYMSYHKSRINCIIVLETLEPKEIAQFGKAISEKLKVAA